MHEQAISRARERLELHFTSKSKALDGMRFRRTGGGTYLRADNRSTMWRGADG